MNHQEIRTALLDIIETVAPGCMPDVIDDDADIREQMDLDSMDVLNIVAAIAERLAVVIPEADVEQITTLNKAVLYISPLTH